MRPSTHQQPPSFLVIAAIAGGFIYWGQQLGWPVQHGSVVWLPALTWILGCLFALHATIHSLENFSRIIDAFGSRKPSGRSGQAAWAKPKDFKSELCPTDQGPFWGLSADGLKKLFIDFDSNAYVVAPSGSGKGHTSVILMIFLIPFSKIITDFKPELLAITHKFLRAIGQELIALDPFGKCKDIVGTTHCLNPLDVIVDALFTDLTAVLDYIKELTLQLLKEPLQAKGDDQFWRSGTRRTKALGILIECMVNCYDATFAAVSRLIDDRQFFEDHLRMIVGVDIDGKPHPQGPIPLERAEWAKAHDPAEVTEFLATIRARMRGLLKLMSSRDSKTYDVFAESASQALEPYSFGKLSIVTGRTTFDFDAVKEEGKVVNIFLVGNAARQEATENFLGIMQWTMQGKLKRHPNKHVPVYLINDEAANYSVYGLTELMSWGRGFGIRIIQYLQNFTAYAQKHGEHAVEVLNSESEIKLFLPGQRSKSTREQIVELLGEQSEMAANYTPETDGSIRTSLSETGRKLMTADEVRRTKHGILIVRQHKPILQIPVSYSRIDPLRDWAGISPSFGKPFRQKIKLKLSLPQLKGKKP